VFSIAQLVDVVGGDTHRIDLVVAIAGIVRCKKNQQYDKQSDPIFGCTSYLKQAPWSDVAVDDDADGHSTDASRPPSPPTSLCVFVCVEASAVERDTDNDKQ
jgi:hypothetical protein